MPRNPFRRSVEVPSDVLSTVRLDRGESVLAATVAKDGRWLLGTRDALLVVDPSGAPARRFPAGPPARVPWQQIEYADWDRDTGRLVVVGVGEFGRVRPSYSFGIEDPGLLLELIRERVTASVVLQRRVVVSGNAGLFVVARRPPRGDGAITWAYEFDPGVDPADQGVMEAARRGLASAEEELGL